MAQPPSPPQQSKPRLGELLMREGLLSAEQLQAGLEEQKSYGGRLGRHLVELGFVGEAQLIDVLVRQLRLQRVDLDVPGVLAPDAGRYARSDLAEQWGFCPVAFDPKRNVLVIAVSDPDPQLLNDIEGFLAMRVEPRVAPAEMIERAHRRLYHGDGAAPIKRLQGLQLSRSERGQGAGGGDALGLGPPPGQMGPGQMGPGPAPMGIPPQQQPGLGQMHPGQMMPAPMLPAQMMPPAPSPYDQQLAQQVALQQQIQQQLQQQLQQMQLQAQQVAAPPPPPPPAPTMGYPPFQPAPAFGGFYEGRPPAPERSQGPSAPPPSRVQPAVPTPPAAERAPSLEELQEQLGRLEKTLAAQARALRSLVEVLVDRGLVTKQEMARKQQQGGR